MHGKSSGRAQRHLEFGRDISDTFGRRGHPFVPA
jgi:hypothetical protein